MKADLRLIRYVYENGKEEFSLIVETKDDRSGSICWVDELTPKQTLGLLMAEVPCEEVEVKNES